MEEYNSLIRENNRFFEDILALHELNTETLEARVAILEAVCYFAWHNHTGRFTSAEIDERITKIAEELDESTSNKVSIQPNKVLFIASQLYVTGGHTKLLENIAKFESGIGNEVSLLIIKQNAEDIPVRITSNKTLFHQIECLQGLPLTDQVRGLRKEIDSAARVYSVQHPSDIVSSIALSLRQHHNVIYVNHADHVFWVGAAFCDRILNIRPYGERLTIERRTTAVPSFVMPVKVAIEEQNMTRASAKAYLNLSENDTVLLTISDLYKVLPDDNYNFFDTIDEILARYSQLHYYFIGITKAEYIQVNSRNPPENLHLLGRLENPAVYQYAADLYLEGMPMNSLTACVDTVHRGAYPILMWEPYHVNMNMESEYYFDGLIHHPKSKEAYLSLLEDALNPIREIARSNTVKQIKERILFYNSDAYWSEMIVEKALNSANLAPNDSKEVEIDIRDLRLVENHYIAWKLQPLNSKIFALKQLRNHVRLSSIFGLYSRSVLIDNEFNTLKKLKMFRHIFLR